MPDAGERQVPLRAIVVDDEPLAREGLRAQLEPLGVQVVATCGDAYAAQEAIREHAPDVLFLDVQMPEVDGFALLESMEPEEIPPAVVFVTAFDEHALRAFKVRALDYLLKPVTREVLASSIEHVTQRLREMRALRDSLESGDASSEPSDGYLRDLVVRDRGETTFVPVADLEWIEADTYYVRLHTASGRPRLLRERMKILERRLDPALFVRTHRSAIVRLDLIRSIRTISKYEDEVVLASGVAVPLSRVRKRAIEELILGRRGSVT